ncbi:hypothetical protein [Bacillus toyonensis]|uniref:hypothetical protein n=1 Tax=Bacillus toyonensis TaxID=155322 RepID=UPI0027B9C46F|nr:hypothetical protein [Bacillus toyonensis]
MKDHSITGEKYPFVLNVEELTPSIKITISKKYEHDEILHKLMNQIQEREIWISNGEVKRYYLSKIGKWFRKIESEWESQISNIEKQHVLEEK